MRLPVGLIGSLSVTQRLFHLPEREVGPVVQIRAPGPLESFQHRDTGLLGCPGPASLKVQTGQQELAEGGFAWQGGMRKETESRLTQA